MKDAPIAGGYILLSRKIIESEIWKKPPLYIKIWIWLLEAAQHKEYKQLKRGQLFCQIEDIQNGVFWYVGYRKVVPTRDQIFQVIDWLRKCHECGNETGTKASMITTMKATHGLLINIDKYDYYQNSKNYESNDEGNDEGNKGATREQRQPDNINKNVKNVNVVDVGDVYSFYQQNIGLMSSHQQQTIGTYLDDGLSPELIMEAMKDSIGADNSWKYLNRVLNNCTTQSVNTLEQYNSKKVERKSKSIGDHRKIERSKKEEDDAAMQQRVLEELRKEGAI